MVTDLAKLLEGIAGATGVHEGPSGPPGSPAGEPGSGVAASAPTKPATPPAPARPAAIVPLKIGDTTVHVPVMGSTVEIGRARQSVHTEPRDADRRAIPEPTAPDLALIARRCELKVRACPVARRRRGLQASDPALEPVLEQLNALIAEGKSLPSCFLWMFWPSEPLPPDAVVERIERNYANLAAAARLVQSVESSADLRASVPAACQLLAEAQSALRCSLRDTWLTKPDADQDDAFLWLAAKAKRDQVYIARHMRLEDPADPELHADLAERIGALQTQTRLAADSVKSRRAAINKLRYHVKRLVDAGNGGLEEEWAAASLAADKCASTGLSPGESEIQDIARPLVGLSSPERFEPGEMLRRILDRAAELEAAADDDAHAGGRTWSRDVEKARDLLRGGRIVLVGGEVYDHAQRRLMTAFDLADLSWVSIREHGSSRPLLPEIADPSTRAVLVMVKLAGHQHIDDARELCRRYSRPLVMLKAGYNPEQVARAVLEQASAALAEFVE